MPRWPLYMMVRAEPQASQNSRVASLDALMTFKELGFSHSISVLGTGVQVWYAAPLICRHMEQWQCCISLGSRKVLKRQLPQRQEPRIGGSGRESKTIPLDGLNGPNAAGDSVPQSFNLGENSLGKALSQRTPAGNSEHRTFPSMCNETKQVLPHAWQKCRFTSALTVPASAEHIESGPSFKEPCSPWSS